MSVPAITLLLFAALIVVLAICLEILIQSRRKRDRVAFRESRGE